MDHHSAQVQMDLHLAGQVYPVAQLGPNFLILKSPMDLPAGMGEIVVVVDDHITRSPIRLPNGASTSKAKTTIEVIP